MSISKVKITAVQKIKPGALLEEYGEGVEEECPVVATGAEYISDEIGMPDGFCPWAWSDIQRDVVHLAMGGDFPWIKAKGTMISCCTDGLRPVIFKLDRMEG